MASWYALGGVAGGQEQQAQEQTNVNDNRAARSAQRAGYFRPACPAFVGHGQIYPPSLTTPAERKQLRALRSKKGREEMGLFLVQGHKMVSELLSSPFKPRAVFATAGGAGALAAQAKQFGVGFEVLPDHELEKLGTFETGNEVVAVLPFLPEASDVAPAMDELVLAVDRLTDPGNLGTILRIADRFGVTRVLCSKGTVEVFNPKCVQASMGSVLRVRVRYDELAVRLRAWASAGAHIYLADGEGSNVFTTELRRPAVLVLGSESHGLSPEVEMCATSVIAIPQFGGAESLNVATAAAALCMEFARRTLA